MRRTHSQAHVLRFTSAGCSTGAEVLRDGGNAVDAAVAVALCQGICNPMASGAGGGHFMLIRQATSHLPVWEDWRLRFELLLDGVN
jgi:gamma-glutamyltranspeptidase